MLAVFKRVPDWCATSPHIAITRSFTVSNPSQASLRSSYLPSPSSPSLLLLNRTSLQPFRSPILCRSYSSKPGKFSPAFFTSRPSLSFFTSNVGLSKVYFNGLRPNSTNTATLSRDTLKAEAAKSTQSTWQEAKKLLVLAKPESKPIGMAILLLLISSGITMSVPFSMGKIIDTATSTISTPIFGVSLPTFFAGLAVVFAIGAAANTGRVVLFRIAGERIIQRLRNDLYRAILRQEMSFFDRERSGDLISRLTVDTNVVGKSLTQNISDGLRSLAMSTAGISMMTYVNPQLTGIMMLIVPPIAVFAVFYGRYVKDLSKKTQTALGEITKVAEERIGNIRTVHAFAKEGSESNRYQMRVQDVFQLAKKEAYASGLFFGGAGLSGNLTVLAVLWYGGSMVMNGEITIGDLTSFMLFTAYVGSSLAGLTGFYSEVMKGIGAGSRVFEILERQTAIPTNVGTILPSAHGKISFDNVSFHYPTRPQSQIFDKSSFTVEPGTVVAICGSSGSGKSTIGSLLLRFYDPTSGTIRVSDTSISQLNIQWWRKQVGLVSQEPVLFAGTIAENIAYGNEGATREEIETAAVKANCATFINTFEKGYDTFVGERGVSLSGGQKQRIAIARALLKDPGVLILDEATSALDAESEFLVQEALDRLMKGRTVFTIAHRISTIKNSDYIVCLDNGKVAEIGTYDELVKKNGVFKRLVEHQLLA